MSLRVCMFCVSFFLFASVMGLDALPNPDFAKSSKSSTYNSKVAYTINIPGTSLGNGNFTPAKIINIQRVKREDYLPNSVHLKTKARVAIDNKSNLLYSSTLMSDLSPLGIKSARLPFVFTEGNIPLAADPYGTDRIIEINYTEQVDPYDVCEQLMKNPEVEYAVPVFVYHTDVTPNDPQIGSQWWVSNLELPQAWDVTKGSKDVIIAIVDSGTDWLHEDLKDNIYTNPKEIAGNGIDDDKNGKIDDVHGWDLVGNINATQISAQAWKEDNDPKNTGISDDNKHGTHVAGCASASTNNGIGVAGTGFNCSILPVKCATDQTGIRGIYRGYEGIAYASLMNADIINCSWGGPGYTPVGQDIINSAIAKGAVVVVAAGNSNQNIDNGEQYPACYDNVVCVGASTSSNKVASFSNTGLAVTVYTPGASILATLPNNMYGSLDGTSMASPITAGLAGLIKSIHKDWTPRQIYHQLRSTCDNVLTTDPNSRPLYYGRSNANKAVTYNNFGGQGIPGVEVSKVIMTSGDALTDYDPKVIRLELTNYLATVSNMTMKIAPQGNLLSVSTQTISVGNIAGGTTKNIDITVQMLPANPWYQGTANLFVTFESTGYTNYQLVKIPVKINTNNKYSSLGTFQENDVPDWSGAYVPNEKTLWAVGLGGMFGNAGGYYRIFNGQTSANAVSNEYLYCIWAKDETTALAGSSSQANTSASIFKTINGGSTWTSSSVTSISTFVNAVNMFDANFGVFLGDPKGTVWGVGKTSDAGKTWSAVTGVPAAQASESGYVGSNYFLGNNAWFGTTKGRVYRSFDKGLSWAVSTITGAGQISKIAFMDKNNGLAVYNETGKSNSVIASTTNGGQTWTSNKYNLTNYQLTPIYFYTSTDAGKIFMLCSGGQVFSTKTNGATWEGVLSAYHGNATIGACGQLSTSKLRMWDIGESIGHLDFSYIPAIINNSVIMTTANAMNFDSVDIGSWKVLTSTFRNTGNVVAHITPVVEANSGIGSDGFKLYAFSADSIQPGADLNVKIRYSPTIEGANSAVLKVATGTATEFQVQLSGFAVKPVSVGDNPIINYVFFIQPNPATDFIEISVGANGPSPLQNDVRIYNVFGQTVLSVGAIHELPLRVDISGLALGMYFVRIGDIISKFVKL